jgi:hypothetical protein
LAFSQNAAPKKKRGSAHFAWCAEQSIPAEAAAAFLYLEQIYILIAEVADVIEGNKLRSPLGSDPRHLSPD